MSDLTPKLRHALMIVRELPNERQDELVTAIEQYASRYSIPTIR